MKASMLRRAPVSEISTGSDCVFAYSPLLFGEKNESGLVAAELFEANGKSEVVLYYRRNGMTLQKRESFHPFIVAHSDVISGCDVEFQKKTLAGNGMLNSCILFRSWEDCGKGVKWLAQKTGISPSAPNAPYLFLNDPVHQHLILSGRTMFLGIQFDDLKRMQVDIECMTSPGYEFCNAEREGDRIIAIAVGDNTGWSEVISSSEEDEKAILQRFIEVVLEKDPDVLEGHNIFNFDLPYIFERAKRHGVRMTLGRDKSTPKRRPSRFTAAERTITYDRFDIFGRHVIDTLFLVHAYDVSHRELGGFGLKEAAIHFGLARKDRTYIDGSRITAEYLKNPGKVMAYVRDDIDETGKLSALLSRSNFVQTQILPYSYQNVCVRGNATKIDALLIREYLRQGHSLPLPGESRKYEGGYTDIFIQGVVKNVHHCDIRSLYPSLMLSRNLAPAKDNLGVFLKLLDMLRSFRLQAKKEMQESVSKTDKVYMDALQAAFKILINSFYGYLGFAQGHFCDFDMAERVTANGRDLLKKMIKWLSEHGAKPVEIDTDGIYFVPPETLKSSELENFRNKFSESLPEGIEIEFDGEYRSMYSYKMKNYALLAADGEMIIKGAALKSRGLEPFQRDFMRDAIRLKLEQRDDEIHSLKKRFEEAIKGRKWPISMFTKAENLQDSPSTYSVKRGGGKRAKSAVYELALRSGRDYRAGDQLSYYVTGNRKSVAVNENAKLATEWKSDNRDENVAYYLAKLDALYEKFGNDPSQAEFDL